MFIRNFNHRLLFAADDGGGSSGSDGDNTSNNNNESGGGNDSGAVAYQQALAAHRNNVEAFARQLFDDNYRLRQTNRDLRGQVAPSGSAILTGDDLALWNAYKGLGKPTDLVLASTVDPIKTDLTNAQTALTTAQAELAQLKRSALLRDVADTAGVVYGVLATLDKPELSYEIVDGKDKDNKPIKTVKVKAGDQNVDLDTYATQHWSAFLPALRPAQNSGTPYPIQAGVAKPTQVTVGQAAQNALDYRYGKKAA